MVYGGVLVLVLTVVFAVNGQQDNTYQDLQNEVNGLKSFILKISKELNNVKKQYDEVREELQDVRSKQRLMDTRLSMKLQKDNEEENEEYHDSNTLNKRAVIVPASSPHWNTSTASTPSCQCSNGSKGEKGDSGLPGPKGDTGTVGSKGDTGAPGSTGRKGDTGPAGSMGPKGENGSVGRTGPQGPKGIQGQQVAFSATTKILVNHTNQAILHKTVVTNVGHDYHGSTGIFTCEVPGIYMFTWSLEVSQGQNVYSHIDVNGSTWSDLAVAGTSTYWNSGSQTIIASLAQGQTVQIIASSHDNTVDKVTCNFSGVLLS